MRAFHVAADQLTEWPDLPEQLPPDGYLWISSVQMHFSAQSHRTGDIMRTLTVLTAIFLPLNLITGVFGMNFDALPLIHSAIGFWIAFGLMACVGIGLAIFFRRKRFLDTHR
jgi:magnesium transporter